MSMMAVFGCSKCGSEAIHGYHKGKESPAPPPEYACIRCKAKTVHSFIDYIYVDERSDMERMRERLQA